MDERSGRVRTAQSTSDARRPQTGQDPKNMTVFGRFNHKTPTTMHFNMSPYTKVFNPDRKQHVVVKDALIDPNLTILSPPKPKDPGY